MKDQISFTTHPSPNTYPGFQVLFAIAPTSLSWKLYTTAGILYNWIFLPNGPSCRIPRFHNYMKSARPMLWCLGKH